MYSLRNLRRLPIKNGCGILSQKKTFLTNDYQCSEAWNAQVSSPLLSKVNLNDLYNSIEQNYASKGVISPIDVDIFANTVKDPTYLEELKDLLHKLRLSSETVNTLDSTKHATVRNFLEFGSVEELITILNDPLNFGLFLDDFVANILLDKLLKSERFDLAAKVSSLVMLQEEYTNDITISLCQYACYKFIESYVPPEPAPKEDPPKKVEEIKIRIKFLRNPYFDDHFDIQDDSLLSGKTLAWMSERHSDNLNNNLQMIGWLIYKKYDKLVKLCENFSKASNFKVYGEVLDLLKKESSNVEDEVKAKLETCASLLNSVTKAETSLEESLKVSIENAINKSQNKDISTQKQLFKSWAEIRQNKLEEQIKRLDRAKRMQEIQEQQEMLKAKEQKLWFFENEDSIDIQIEGKEALVEKSTTTQAVINPVSDENYIPPEIVRGRK